MAQILVRGLDGKVVERLKTRARKEGRSLQSAVKHILEQSAFESKVDPKAARKISEEFHRKFRGRKFPDTAGLIREDRDR